MSVKGEMCAVAVVCNYRMPKTIKDIYVISDNDIYNYKCYHFSYDLIE